MSDHISPLSEVMRFKDLAPKSIDSENVLHAMEAN